MRPPQRSASRCHDSIIAHFREKAFEFFAASSILKPESVDGLRVASACCGSMSIAENRPFGGCDPSI